MRICRYLPLDLDNAAPRFGVVEGEGDDLVVAELAGHPIGEIAFTGARTRLADVRLLAPILPTKIVAAGRNYADHARELGNDVPAEPMIFLKPSSSVIGPGDPIVWPRASERVDHEAELAVVMGRLVRNARPEQIAGAILGYTCANDVSARDLQKRDGQWGRAKGFDTFCPLGPWIETELDLAGESPLDLEITCDVGDERRQSGRTNDMVFGVAELVAWISGVVTLLPGDVVLTGTPAGVGPLSPGADVTVEIDGIGQLRNPVIRL